MNILNVSFPRFTTVNLTENAIIAFLVSSLRQMDCEIGVHDGEERVLALGKHDLIDVLKHVGHTDETLLKVLPPEPGAKIALIQLIHGNESDVISDYSVSLEERMKPTFEFIEKLDVE